MLHIVPGIEHRGTRQSLSDWAMLECHLHQSEMTLHSERSFETVVGSETKLS